MSFPAYPEYKNSGVEWLGELPANWDLGPIRRGIEETAERNWDDQSSDYLSLVVGRGVIPYAEKGDVGNKKPEDLSKCKIVAEGDFVLNSMNFGIGAFGRSSYDGVCSPVYVVMRAKPDELLPEIFAYLMQIPALQRHAQSFGNGILAHRSAIGWDELKGLRIAYPPIPHQRAIAAFLDRETAKIDAAVAAQERLIALLAEKRAATISHAVTKGLDPDAPMKDSGIEWLGQIPAHWSTPAISHVCDEIGSGTTPSTNDEQAYGGEVCWVTTGELRETGIYSTRKRLTEAALADYSALRKFPPGTLLIAMYGATIGRLGWLECEAATNQACCAMQMSEPYLSRFLFYVLQGGKSALILLGSGGGQPNISQEKVRQFRFALPPHEEQESILNHLDSACSQIDALNAKALSSIRLLKERRAALISAAVTGKIDVRGEVNAREQEAA